MSRKYKFPFLYTKEWWINNKHKTDVAIGREYKCPPSTVRVIRHKMGIAPLKRNDIVREQWHSIDFRKKRCLKSELYTEEFWLINQDKNNTEIAKEIKCQISSVKAARSFMGIAQMTASESQIRRYHRGSIPQKRIELNTEQRNRILQRANYQCEVPICKLNGDDILHIEHIKDMASFTSPEDSNTDDNLLVLCKWHHKWWTKYKKDKNYIGTYEMTKTLFRQLFPL